MKSNKEKKTILKNYKVSLLIHDFYSKQQNSSFNTKVSLEHELKENKSNLRCENYKDIIDSKIKTD